MTCGHEVWLGLVRGVLTVCSWCQSCVVCRAVVLDGHIAVNFNMVPRPGRSLLSLFALLACAAANQAETAGAGAQLQMQGCLACQRSDARSIGASVVRGLPDTGATLTIVSIATPATVRLQSPCLDTWSLPTGRLSLGRRRNRKLCRRALVRQRRPRCAQAAKTSCSSTTS